MLDIFQTNYVWSPAPSSETIEGITSINLTEFGSVENKFLFHNI